MIVGGGVAGLSLALHLNRIGKTFQVVEAGEPGRQTGAGLLLAPNATRVLDGLGLLGEAMAKGLRVSRWYVRDWRGSVLRCIKIPAEGPPALSIHRGELIGMMRNKLPVGSIATSRRVVGWTAGVNGIAVDFAQGPPVTAQALVGADGIRSMVRQRLFGEWPLLYRGYIGWRGMAPFVPDKWERESLVESWGIGGRFGIAPVDAQRSYWYASANRAETLEDAESTRKQLLLRRFGQWHEPIRELIERTPADRILVSRIYDCPKLRGWSKDRVTLVGDAAHAMTPNLGQGACQAMEDAAVLAGSIEHFPEPAEAFRQYERCRINRVASIQNRSRAMGWVVQAENRWAVALRGWMAPRVPEPLVRWGMRDIFAGQVLGQSG